MNGAGGAGGFGGFSGGGFSMEDIFEQFGDIFGGAFGGGFGGFGGGRSRQRRQNRGTDIRVTVKLTLKEISEGVTKKLKISKNIACSECSGTGAKSGSGYSTCTKCGGSGYVITVQNSFFGRMQTQSQCPDCQGEGRILKERCTKCGGEGTERGQEVVEVNIPAGVAEGMALTVRGRGNAARQGGVNGDLIVVIEEEHNPELVRDGDDLLHNLKISVTTAILGGEVEVPTIDSKAKIKIAPGTQAGKVLRLKGKGLPELNGYGRGDILVIVDIVIPTKLTSEEKKLLEKLSDQPNFKKVESAKGEQNIFDRMRNFFS
jgi:molecular chaperone DnaJ